MNKQTFIILFFSTQLLLIVLHIHKQSTFVHYTYAKQNNEQTLIAAKKTLQQKQAEIMQLEDLATIKTYAHTKLGMEQISKKQIKRILT